MLCVRTYTTRHPARRFRVSAAPVALHIATRFRAGLFDEKEPHCSYHTRTHSHDAQAVSSNQSAHSQSSFSTSSTSSTQASRLDLLNSHRMQRDNVLIERQAYGIPFHITDNDAIDRAQRYHGHVLHVHCMQHLLMPFWLVSTSTAGTFQADVLQNDPAFVTQPHSLTWIEGPCYQFSYPFGEFMPLNQLSASYEEPFAAVEACCAGSHIPSMLLARYELLHALQRMPQPPRLIDFALSTHTALSVLERRYSRALLLHRIDSELHKFHGSFVRSQVRVMAVRLEAVRIRPVFLPLIKLKLSCASSTMPWTTWVCGAMGTVVSSLHGTSRHRRHTWMTSSALLSGACTFAVSTEPGVALAAGLAVAVTVPALLRQYQHWRMLHRHRRECCQRQRARAENVWSDRLGYCWGVESEEQAEYASREILRRRAQKKAAFEQMAKEEAVHARVRADGGVGVRVDAKRRLREDVKHADTLRYYAILGLQGREVTATRQDIVLAFRRAVRVHHPDVHPQDESVCAECTQPMRAQAGGRSTTGACEAHDGTSSRVDRESNHSSRAHTGQEEHRMHHISSSSIRSSSSSKEYSAEMRKEHIQQLIAAYKVLRDPVARKKYDAGEMKPT